MDAGYIFPRGESSPRTASLRALAHAGVDVAPTLSHTGPVVILDQSERRVMELDQRSARFFAQPVLHVRRDRIRHKKRPVELEQRRPLDRLDVPPQIPVVVAKVAVPPTTRPGLELHGQRIALGRV